MLIPNPKLPADVFNPAKEKVVFRLRYMRKKRQYSCDKLSNKQVKQAINKLKEYRGLTVIQFRSSSGVRLKPVKKRDFPAPPAQLSEEISDMLGMEFRISDKFRALGYFHMAEFYILLLDPDHSFCG